MHEMGTIFFMGFLNKPGFFQSYKKQRGEKVENENALGRFDEIPHRLLFASKHFFSSFGRKGEFNLHENEENEAFDERDDLCRVHQHRTGRTETEQ